jgi:hypothetical protein
MALTSLPLTPRQVGNLVKILHGTKGEMLLDVVWHPVRPIVASISSGVISVWAQQQVGGSRGRAACSIHSHPVHYSTRTAN